MMMFKPGDLVRLNDECIRQCYIADSNKTRYGLIIREVPTLLDKKLPPRSYTQFMILWPDNDITTDDPFDLQLVSKGCEQ